MNILREIPRLALLVLGVSLSSSMVKAQGYSLDEGGIDGFHGESAGGTYSVNGVIEPPATEGMRAGAFTLQGGFDPGFIVASTGGAPTLFIQRSGGNILISWSPIISGFVLEETIDLASPSWSRAPDGPIPMTAATRFYRLRSP